MSETTKSLIVIAIRVCRMMATLLEKILKGEPIT